MDILKKIILHKRNEVQARRELYPVALLEKSVFFDTKPVSMKAYLLRSDKSGIIAEIKRKSPSKGIINNYVSVERTSIGYMQAGASALSILTDKDFFGGSNEDLVVARRFNYCPILRKDFILDEYQIIEAKSIGADAVLLIAAAMSPDECLNLAAFAVSLGMEVLLEIHSREEFLSHCNQYISIIGVNNRNLKDFEVKIETSLSLASMIDERFIWISESGIDSAETILQLRKEGYKGFLIGESFMRKSRPERECMSLISRINNLHAYQTRLDC